MENKEIVEYLEALGILYYEENYSSEDDRVAIIKVNNTSIQNKVIELIETIFPDKEWYLMADETNIERYYIYVKIE